MYVRGGMQTNLTLSLSTRNGWKMGKGGETAHIYYLSIDVGYAEYS